MKYLLTSKYNSDNKYLRNMNTLRKNILNVIGYILGKWDQTRLAKFMTINSYTIKSQRNAVKLRNRTLRIDGEIAIVGSKYICIGDYTHIGNRSIITAWDSTADGRYHTPSIIIGNNCSIGGYNHITSTNRIKIGNNVLTGRWVTITDNNHGETNFSSLQTPPLQRPVISKGPVVIGE